MSKRPFWNAAAAVALAPAAAFSFANTYATSFANTHATSARHLVTRVAVRAVMVDTAPLGLSSPGLVGEPAVVAAPLSDELLLHTAITTARLEHTRALIAAARARTAARKAAAQRRASERRAAAHARAAAAHARAELVTQAQGAAVPAAAAGSWQRIVASLAGRGAGCLDNIIERESGGDVSATNPDGAYGIPQALPGSKMASAGADWQTNPETQIRWMIGYTNETYGSACAAWMHEEATGSY